MKAPGSPPDPGPPPELAWLPVDRLDIDPAYQRTIETPASRRLIAKIAAQFDWLKFGALTAAPGEADDTGPRWWLLDGQHRTAGVRLRGGIGHLPALVHRQTSRAEQAMAFVAANRDRVAISAQALFKARLAAGDPEALTLQRLADAAGIRLLHYRQSAIETPAGSTPAVAALLYILRHHNEAVLGGALAAVGGAFGHQPGGLRGPYFLAAALCLKEGGGAESTRLALTRLGVRAVERLAEGLGPHSAAKALAAALQRQMPTGHPPMAAPATRNAPAAPPRPAAAGAAPGPAPETSASPGCREADRVGNRGVTAGRDRHQQAPAAPVADAKRAAEEAAIAQFLAAKGARQIASPEQVAQFLRDNGRKASIAERFEPTSRGRPDRRVRQPMLDGESVSLAQFYAAANKLRAAAGLPPLELPASERAA